MNFIEDEGVEKGDYSAVLTEMAWNHFKLAAKLPDRTVKLGYVGLVTRDAKLSKVHLLSAMIYTDRIQERNPLFLETISSSDLFLISLLVASKFLYDEGEDDAIENSGWASIGRRKIKAINALERKFLAALNWDVFINPREYEDFLDGVDARLSFRSALAANGCFSYSDLNAIWSWLVKRQDLTESVHKSVVQVFLICGAVYVGMVCVTFTVGHAMATGGQFYPTVDCNAFYQNTTTRNLTYDNVALVGKIACRSFVRNRGLGVRHVG